MATWCHGEHLIHIDVKKKKGASVENPSGLLEAREKSLRQWQHKQKKLAQCVCDVLTFT
jgi:hypothetical protein